MLNLVVSSLTNCMYFNFPEECVHHAESSTRDRASEVFPLKPFLHFHRKSRLISYRNAETCIEIPDFIPKM